MKISGNIQKYFFLCHPLECVLSLFLYITLCPSCPSKLCYNHPSSSKRATALAMPDAVTPMCRAISGIDNRNPSPRPFAILAGPVLILLRRLSSLRTFDPIPPFLHSLLGAVNYIATRDATSPIRTVFFQIMRFIGMRKESD